MNFQATRAALEADWGIILPPGVTGFATDEQKRNWAMACDAQPALATVGNNGIPAWLVNLWDPEPIRVLQAPMAGTEIAGEQKRGTWIDRTITFTMVEPTGYVSSYGDFNNNGANDINAQFPVRQSYYYQTISQYGERQAETYGAAKLNYVSEQRIAGANTLNRYQNRTYIFGVQGLQNYGYLNDPSLPAAVTPITKQAGGTSWSVATPNEIFSDFQKLYGQLVTQSNGIIKSDMQFTFVLPPISSIYFDNVNSFGVVARNLIQRAYPNVKVVTAIEYGSAAGLVAGNTAQLICTSLDGVQSAFAGFNEKMRAHPVVVGLSSFSQKMSQGTWGAIIRRPFAIATMVGI